jgi:hypothetical protein
VSVLTEQQIKNLYLYCTLTAPEDKTSASLIRPPGDLHYQVNINDYMADEGRFASPAHFKLIQDFFASTNLPVRTYTKTELAAQLGYAPNAPIFEMLHWQYQDGVSDTLIGPTFGTTWLSRSTTKAVSSRQANNVLSIENFAIVPFSDQNNTENFDFTRRRSRVLRNPTSNLSWIHPGSGERS